MTTLETLRKLRDEIRERVNHVEFANTGWYNGSCTAHTKDADLIDAEIKRLEGMKEKS